SGKIPPRLTPRPCVRATARLPGHRLAFDKPVEAVTYIAMPAGEMHRNKALQRAFFRPIAANATELSTVETCSSPEKQAICRVIRLFDEVVPDLTQEILENRLIGGRDLHAHEHAPVVRTVIAVVEQADVPAAAHAVEEAHQRPRAVRKFEAVDDLVLGRRR